MTQFYKKHWLTIIGILVGATAGFIYWQQVGCNSGSCAITSNPTNSTLYGSIMGGLLFSFFKKSNKTSDNKSSKDFEENV